MEEPEAEVGQIHQQLLWRKEIFLFICVCILYYRLCQRVFWSWSEPSTPALKTKAFHTDAIERRVRTSCCHPVCANKGVLKRTKEGRRSM